MDRSIKIKIYHCYFRTKEEYERALRELETWRRQSEQSANEVEQKDRQIAAVQREVRVVFNCHLTYLMSSHDISCMYRVEKKAFRIVF